MAFDNSKPGDDTTALVIKAKKVQYIDLFAGPPKDPANDADIIKSFMKGNGKKIICGGTAANIASRELHKPLKVDMNYADKEIPPTAEMDGIDLITEGVLTLSKTVELIKNYSKSQENLEASDLEFGEDAASKLSEILIFNCSHLNLWVGKAVNPAHQNPDFPTDLSIKLNIILELKDILLLLGKKVYLNYV